MFAIFKSLTTYDGYFLFSIIYDRIIIYTNIILKYYIFLIVIILSCYSNHLAIKNIISHYFSHFPIYIFLEEIKSCRTTFLMVDN